MKAYLVMVDDVLEYETNSKEEAFSKAEGFVKDMVKESRRTLCWYDGASVSVCEVLKGWELREITDQEGNTYEDLVQTVGGKKDV